MRIAKAGVLKDDELAMFRQIKVERQIARLSGDDKELKRLCDEFHRLRWERGIKRFELGRTYFRMDGRPVIIVACKDENRGYECVVASDGTKKSPEIHRYNRSTQGLDNGRVTGSDHCFTDPRNLIAEAS